MLGKLFTISTIFAVLFIFLSLFSFFASPLFAQEESEAFFFWGRSCPHCVDEEVFLEELKDKYPSLRIKSFEVYNDKENRSIFEKVAQGYGVSSVSVPAFFIGDDHLIGFLSPDTTGKKIETLIKKYQAIACPSPGRFLEEGEEAVDCTPEETKESWFSFLGVEGKISHSVSLPVLGVVLGLADGINPCMFSVLLFLITYLLAIGSRKRMFKVGFTFIAGVFVVYVFLMLGLLNLISLLGWLSKIRLLVALVALFFGLVMVKDFFFYGRWFSLEIPKKTKPQLENLIKRGTIVSALVLALFSSLVELPCTSGLPLVYVTILAERGLVAWPYILWYNLFFILPLVFIVVSVGLAYQKIDQLEKWRKRFRKVMRLVSGLLLLFLSAGLFLGWF